MSRDLLRQPKAVWAVAFACVIAFMGIGLVDPILPALARELDASPSQVELLFTSYFAATGVSMLVTGWVSSRIGAKRTLVAGLVLIVLFSAAACAAAPYLAGKMAERWTPHVPFYVGAASVTVAIGVLACSRAHLRGVDESLGHEPRVVEPEPLVAALGD